MLELIKQKDASFYSASTVPAQCRHSAGNSAGNSAGMENTALFEEMLLARKKRSIERHFFYRASSISSKSAVFSMPALLSALLQALCRHCAGTVLAL